MSFVRAYEGFLLENASQITAVESSLRTLTYFLPGRFKDAELAGEAIYTTLNLLGLYHDTLLADILSPPHAQDGAAAAAAAATASSKSGSTSFALAAPAPPGGALTAPGATNAHAPTAHARYTAHFARNSPSYRLLARALLVIGHSELLAEMLARRKLGSQKAWNVVLGIEGIKAVLRLSLVHLTRNRPLIQPPLPEREVDPATLEEERTRTMGRAAQRNAAGEIVGPRLIADGRGGFTSSYEMEDKTVWKGTRTGLTRRTLASLRPGLSTEGAESAVSLRSRPAGSGPRSNRSGSMSDTSSSDETLVNASTSASGLLPGASSPQPAWTEKDVNEYLLSRTLTPTDVRPADKLVRPLRGAVGQLAEGIWIMRPVAYVLALRRAPKGAYYPYLISLALEYLARVLRLRSQTIHGGLGAGASSAPSLGLSTLLLAFASTQPILGRILSLFIGGAGGGGGGAALVRPASEAEAHEWERRGRSFWWYALRGPFWEHVSKPRLEGVASRLENRALLGIFGGMIRDYVPLIDSYHYYVNPS